MLGKKQQKRTFWNNKAAELEKEAAEYRRAIPIARRQGIPSHDIKWAESRQKDLTAKAKQARGKARSAKIWF